MNPVFQVTYGITLCIIHYIRASFPAVKVKYFCSHTFTEKKNHLRSKKPISNLENISINIRDLYKPFTLSKSFFLPTKYGHNSKSPTCLLQQMIQLITYQST